MNRLLASGLMCAAINFTLTGVARSQDTIPSPGGEITPAVKSYALGLEMGSQLRRQGFESGDIDSESIASGIVDAIQGNKPKISKEQIKAAFKAIDSQLQARMELRVKEQQARIEAVAGPNQEKADAFLADNATKEGVVQLPSGLQYKVITAGTGDSPKPGSTVKVHYTGKLIGGKVFDSSVERGQPAQFGVGQVIAGWTEALQKMKVGSKWMLYIPPDLAYGKRGSPARNPNEPPTIGPNEALIFEVELLDIVK